MRSNNYNDRKQERIEIRDTRDRDHHDHDYHNKNTNIASTSRGGVKFNHFGFNNNRSSFGATLGLDNRLRNRKISNPARYLFICFFFMILLFVIVFFCCCCFAFYFITIIINDWQNDVSPQIFFVNMYNQYSQKLSDASQQ